MGEVTTTVRDVVFDLCPVCGSSELSRLPDDWQTGGAIPIVACGNPFHYAVRSLGDGPPEREAATAALERAVRAVNEVIFDLPIGEDVTYSRGYSAGIAAARESLRAALTDAEQQAAEGEGRGTR